MLKRKSDFEDSVSGKPGINFISAGLSATQSSSSGPPRCDPGPAGRHVLGLQGTHPTLTQTLTVTLLNGAVEPLQVTPSRSVQSMQTWVSERGRVCWWSHRDAGAEARLDPGLHQTTPLLIWMSPLKWGHCSVLNGKIPNTVDEWQNVQRHYLSVCL